MTESTELNPTTKKTRKQTTRTFIDAEEVFPKAITIQNSEKDPQWYAISIALPATSIDPKKMLMPLKDGPIKDHKLQVRFDNTHIVNLAGVFVSFSYIVKEDEPALVSLLYRGSESGLQNTLVS